MAEIDALLDGVRAGRGGALLLTGEPGIGKSSLLAYARDRAHDAVLLSATGVATESGLGYAFLRELLSVVMDTQIPRPQARALAAALGRGDGGDGDPPDPYLTSLAALSVLSAAATGRFVLCLADDLHWADQPSLGALAFAARRLTAEPVVLLASSRTTLSIAGIPELQLRGLDQAAAGALVGERAAPAVRDALVSAAAGNPLALTELPDGLTAAQLAGKTPLPDPLPLPGELERVFAGRLSELSADAQSMALVCAAAGSADLSVILRAAAALGLPESVLDPLDGLLAADGTFCHPLVRSAAYYSATAGERRAAHRALADAVPDADRRAWHLAAAATGPDAAAAAALEESAERTLRRSGYLAAAGALERAATLSVRPADALRRLAAAADAAWRGGDAVRVTELLGHLDRLGVPDPAISLRLRHLRGLIELRAGVPGDGLAILLPAAAEAVVTDPPLAVTMLAVAGECAFQAGDTAGQAAIAALTTKLPDVGDEPHALLASLYKAVSGGEPSRQLDGVLDALDALDDPDLLARAGGMAYGLGAYPAARKLRRRAVERARALGAAGSLAWALRSAVMEELGHDRYAWAEAYATEGLALATETGQPNLACQHRAFLAQVAALRGDAGLARRLTGEVLAEAAGRGLTGTAALARLALINLALASGQPEDALTQLDALLAVATLRGIALRAVPDLVEAAVRAGRPEVATAPLGGYLVWADASATAEGKALAARCRALLADEPDEQFIAALGWHDAADHPLETARTALLFGEYLRRVRRRVDARDRLRSALETFTSLGATGWAARAAAELRATGETVAATRDSTTLTAQELQVARLVGEGLTNRDAAAQLFISPRTVDHHLRNIYRKFGISSRTELARCVM
jgi:DNA-binding CsgD family transcriptional regulator